AFDALGSTEALLDDSGSVTGRLANRAFGLATTATGTGATEPHAWVGQQGYRRDTEADLYLLGTSGNGDGKNRPGYDPATAVFLSKDPLEERGGSSNLYLYCANDPVNKIDPSGNAVFVRYNQAITCSQSGNSYSVASDILRDELYHTYHTWEPREAVRF